MRAVIWTNYGPPEVLQLQEVEQPGPRRDEILIKVHAANAFPGDAEMRRFQMHPSMWIPLRLFMGIRRPRLKVLGQEVAGIVEAVGEDVREFVPGDPVFGATGMRFGGYAEYVSLPARYALARKPEAISYEQASTIAVGGGNALHFIRLARLKAGDRILINGACGCIGTYAVQLAKMNGAEITVTDSADKLDVLRELGADHVIDYEQEDFTRRREKYDVILDIVGKSHFSRSMRCLAAGGRYLLANHGLTVMLRGRVTSWLGRHRVISRLADPSKPDIEYLAGLMAAGNLAAVIDRIYPLDEVVEAHRFIETGMRKGHVVLNVAGSAGRNDVA